MGFLAVFVEVRDETLDSLVQFVVGLLLLDVHVLGMGNMISL